MNGPMLLCRPRMLPIDRPRPVRPETRELTELRALRTRLPELAPAIDMQVELVELHRRIQLRVSTPSPVPPGERQARLGQGRRALELADVPIEWSDAGLAARQTADILHRHETIDSADHRNLVALVREGADLAPLVRAWYAETALGPATQRQPPPGRRCSTTSCNWRCGPFLDEPSKWPNAGSTWPAGAGPGVPSAGRLPTWRCISMRITGNSSAAAASAAGSGSWWGARGARRGTGDCYRPSRARTGDIGSAPAMAAAAT